MRADDRFAESRQRLWIVPAAPVVWAVHFTACYVTGALWCGRFGGPGNELGPAHTAITVYTLIGLAIVAMIGVTGYRAHRVDGASPPHDADSSADRHRFLGYATFLLAGFSAIAIAFSAMAVWMMEGCR